jgi:hypothetical protein
LNNGKVSVNLPTFIWGPDTCSDRGLELTFMPILPRRMLHGHLHGCRHLDQPCQGLRSGLHFQPVWRPLGGLAGTRPGGRVGGPLLQQLQLVVEDKQRTAVAAAFTGAGRRSRVRPTTVAGPSTSANGEAIFFDYNNAAAADPDNLSLDGTKEGRESTRGGVTRIVLL